MSATFFLPINFQTLLSLYNFDTFSRAFVMRNKLLQRQVVFKQRVFKCVKIINVCTTNNIFLQKIKRKYKLRLTQV